MTSIAEILQPEHVVLSLEADSQSAAVEEILGRLDGSGAVRDFPALRAAVLERQAAAVAECGTGFCIAHGRTEAVTRLVMAAGIAREGIACHDASEPIRLFFVAGIPVAFRADYLRIVGAIARICRDHTKFQRLLAAKTPARFVELLAAGEIEL